MVIVGKLSPVWPQEVGEVSTIFGRLHTVPGFTLSQLEPWDFVLWSHFGKYVPWNVCLLVPKGNMKRVA